ncbi:hypothetical protein GCM10009789_39640 [Kribbella sancticallisti]|uniref:Uncharacterized protein n=1 Tax=Kribbella sancticallisti TaxID=460087 RepID=A0ABP4PI68_9ACTN
MGLDVEVAAAAGAGGQRDQGLTEQTGGEGEREQRAGEAAHEGFPSSGQEGGWRRWCPARGYPGPREGNRKEAEW